MPYGTKPTRRLMRNQTAIDEGPILLVDDDLDIREILSEALGDLGFQVVAAANGREALALVEDLEVGPSVILLDLMMPIMDGYGFLEARANDPKLAAVPVAVVTAGHGIDDERIGDGIPVIRKPFELSRLVDVLARLRAPVRRRS
jgi:two-component system response regulator CpxR